MSRKDKAIETKCRLMVAWDEGERQIQVKSKWAWEILLGRCKYYINDLWWWNNLVSLLKNIIELYTLMGSVFSLSPAKL